MDKKTYSNITLERRLLAIIILVVVAFFIIFFRLVFVQIIKGQIYSSLAQDQWTRSLSIEAKRGTIYDTNGNVLATSYTTYNVYIRPSEVIEDASVARILSNALSLTYDKAYSIVTTSGISEVLVASQISKEQLLEIKEADLKGIYFSENNKRYYPYGDLLTQVLGFTTIDNIGQAGLESYYDKFLQGIDGEILTESDLIGRELNSNITSFIPSIDGNNLYTSIDVNLQAILENTLEQCMEEQGAKGATGILMKAKTGEIVAMSSKPSFDLNNVPRDDVESMLDTVKNSAIVDVYEPGSTFKLFTLAAALEEGVTSLEDTFYDPGYRIIDGEKIKCWKTIGHGNETLTEGFCNSCNSVFMDLALRLGTDTFYEYLEKFGINGKTGVDFDGESSGILMTQSNVKNVDLARMGFGHAVAVTMLGLVTGICSVVNGGYSVTPSFVSSIESASGNLIKTTSSGSTQIISESTSSTICNMMYQAVNKTTMSAFLPGYKIGGKTGTAQKYDANGQIADGKYVSSFVGIYPYDDPEYVLLIAVDEPSNGVYYGSLVAAPYGKIFFSQMVEYLGIEPTNLAEDLKKVEKTITIPNCVGMSLANACASLKVLGLNYEIDGEGAFVTWQLKPGGEMTYVNDTVYLNTE